MFTPNFCNPEGGNNSVLYLYPPFTRQLAKNQQQRKNKTYFYFRRNSRPRWNDRVCALKTELTNQIFLKLI